MPMEAFHSLQMLAPQVCSMFRRQSDHIWSLEDVRVDESQKHPGTGPVSFFL